MQQQQQGQADDGVDADMKRQRGPRGGRRARRRQQQEGQEAYHDGDDDLQDAEVSWGLLEFQGCD